MKKAVVLPFTYGKQKEIIKNKKLLYPHTTIVNRVIFFTLTFITWYRFLHMIICLYETNTAWPLNNILLLVSYDVFQKNSQELEWFDIPVHELNLDQLQMLQVSCQVFATLHSAQYTFTVILGQRKISVYPFSSLFVCYVCVEMHD